MIKMGIQNLSYIKIHKALSAIKDLSHTRTIHSRGLTFKLITDSWITKYRARTFNEKEPEMLDWLDQNLLDEDVFFDIGANIGIYSIYAAMRRPNAKVIAFEPEYSNLHEFKKNILKNKLTENILIYSIALDKSSGISHLHIQDETPGAALATVSSDNLKVTATGHPIIWKEGVAAMKIDDFSKNIGIKPTMIKIDVDGNELSILKGGKETLSNQILKTIFIEVDNKKRGCEEILVDYGFVLTHKIAENQIWKRS